MDSRSDYTTYCFISGSCISSFLGPVLYYYKVQYRVVPV